MITKSIKQEQELPLLTLKQACELLGCHPNTLRQWGKNGTLEAVRLGVRKDRRYRKEDVLKLMGKTSYIENEKEALNVSEVRKGYFKEYASLLVKWGELTENSIFVDLPCGTGEMTSTLLKTGYGKKFYCIDINKEMINAAQKNILNTSKGVFKVGDAGDIATLVPEKVDMIFCLNGFNIYIDHKEDFLKGCYNILKPGGVLIFDISTRGIQDKKSKEFLIEQKKELERLANKLNAQCKMPEWPDESSMEDYRQMAIKNNFSLNETVSIDKWTPATDMITDTLKIPGRLRPWLVGITEKQRIEIYKEASDIAIKKTGIETIKHSRVFFIAKKM
jgi:excisionase family DNA binding protein